MLQIKFMGSKHILWIKFMSNCTQVNTFNVSALVQVMAYCCQMMAVLSLPQCVKCTKFMSCYYFGCCFIKKKNLQPASQLPINVAMEIAVSYNPCLVGINGSLITTVSLGGSVNGFRSTDSKLQLVFNIIQKLTKQKWFLYLGHMY